MTVKTCDQCEIYSGGGSCQMSQTSERKKGKSEGHDDDEDVAEP